MLFWSVFLKTHKKPLLTGQNGVFAVKNFFLCIFKNTNEKNICAFSWIKAETWRQIFFFLGGGFLQKPKMHFSGVQNDTF